MDNKYNTITFNRNDYMEYNDYTHRREVCESTMWDDIKEFIRIAVKNGYQLKIWSDELTVAIEYNYQDINLGNVGLEWVGENEFVETVEVTENESNSKS